ncbi:hypothetical protein V2J09_015343 [Rumex salicifolius]
MRKGKLKGKETDYWVSERVIFNEELFMRKQLFADGKSLMASGCVLDCYDVVGFELFPYPSSEDTDIHTTLLLFAADLIRKNRKR